MQVVQGDHDHTEERNRLREKWLRQGRTREQIAVAMGRRFYDRKRAAWRNAYGWSQQHVADLFNKKLGDPNNPITGSRISDYERWPISSQTKPTIPTLGILADVYGATILDLVDDDDYPKMNRKERAYLAALKKQLSAAGKTTHGGPPFPYADSMRPQQLPNVSPYFVGRTQELDKLTAQLDNITKSGPIVITAIGGTAGIGKTALAVQWAQTHSDEFPDGQLYVNLRGFHPTGTPMAPQEAIRGFLDAFYVPVEKIPTSPDAQADLYRKIIKDKWLLIVLDNARDADQVRPLLSDSPTCMVLITSRQQLNSLADESKGATHITLGYLTTAEAHQLLTEILGPKRIQGEPEAVDELIHRCVHLPIALRIAARRIKAEPHTSLNALVGQLREQRQRLTAFSTGDSQYFDIRAVFSWSYTALTTGAARLFRLLGLHRGPDIGTPAAASLAGLPEHDTHQFLTELTRAYLLQEHALGRYQLHDLLRAYASEQALAEEPEPQRQAAMLRMLDHYLHTCVAADRQLYPGRALPIILKAPHSGAIVSTITDRPQALKWFTNEQTVLLAVIHHAATEGFNTHAWQLPWALATFLNWRGNHHDHVDIQQVAVAAANRVGDRAAQAVTYQALGLGHIQFGRYPDAEDYLQRSLALYQGFGDRNGQAHLHRCLYWLYARQGQYAQALTHTHHCLDLYRSIGNHTGQARAFSNLGWHEAQFGDCQQALTYCQQALELNRELGDNYGEAQTLDTLGYIYHRLKRHDQAITYYQQAVALRHELSEHEGEAETLTRLGDTHHARGKLVAAREAWQQALTIFEQHGHPDVDTVRAKLAALNTDFGESTAGD